jgi:hypothetical protein
MCVCVCVCFLQLFSQFTVFTKLYMDSMILKTIDTCKVPAVKNNNRGETQLVESDIN